MIIWGAQLLCEARLTSALELYRSESIFCFTWHVIGSVGTPRTQHTSSIPSRIKHVNKSPVLVVVSQLVKLESKVAIPNPRSRSHDCGANAIYARRVRDRGRSQLIPVSWRKTSRDILRWCFSICLLVIPFMKFLE